MSIWDDHFRGPDDTIRQNVTLDAEILRYKIHKEFAVKQRHHNFLMRHWKHYRQFWKETYNKSEEEVTKIYGEFSKFPPGAKIDWKKYRQKPLIFTEEFKAKMKKIWQTDEQK